MYVRTLHILPDRCGGGWMIETPREFIHCKDSDHVGAYLEQALWPLLSPLLNGRRGIKITITEDEM